MKKLTALALAVISVSAACGESGSDRPELATWDPQWTELRDLIPDSTDVESDGVEVCSQFLGDVRERRNDVIPTPEPSLDQPITEWVAEAETIGLDCDREGDLVERLTDLHERGDSIDAEIARLRG